MLVASSSAGSGSPRALSALLSCSTASAFTGLSPRFSVPPSLPDVTRLRLLSASCSYHCLPPTHLFCPPCHLCLSPEHRGPGEDIPPGRPASVSAASVLGTAALCLLRGFGWFGSGPPVGIHTLFRRRSSSSSGALPAATPTASPQPASAGLCTLSLSGPPGLACTCLPHGCLGVRCPLCAPSTPYSLPCPDPSAFLLCSWPAFSCLRGFQELNWRRLVLSSVVPWKEEAQVQRRSPLPESSNLT